MSSLPKSDRRLLRQKMVKNKVRLLNFYLSHGRDFLQEVLEVYTSPALLYEELIQSDYYSGLSLADQEALYSIKDDNTFSDLELEQTFYLLTRFTQIKQPLCGWYGQCQVQDLKSDHIGENLEKFMSLWNLVNKSNFMADEIYEESLQTLKTLGDNVSSFFAFGKAFRESMNRELEDDDKCPGDIQIVSCGKDVSIQIGQNNKCIMNVEVFDHLQSHEESGNTEAEDDLVKMILHLNTTSTSGLYVARIEERILRSLSGEQLLEINKVLQEKFGVQIVVSRKGCVVLVLRKMKPISQNLMDKGVLREFVSILFKLIGFSNDDLSKINVQVDLTLGNSADVDHFKESQLKNTVLDVTLAPRYAIQRMSDERKRELVSTILEVADPNLEDENEELQITAHFMNEFTDCGDSISSKHTEKSSGANPVCLSIESEEFSRFTPNAHEMKKQNHESYFTMKYSKSSSKTHPLLHKEMEPVKTNSNFFVNIWCVQIIILVALFTLTLFLLNFANIQTTNHTSSQTPTPCNVIQNVSILKDAWPTDRKLAIRNRSYIEALPSNKNKSAIFHLDLSCNNFSFINLSIFHKFSRLSHLNLSTNSMHQVVGLDLVPSLRFLDLSSNSLTRISDLQTLSTSSITVLDLKNNYISSLNSTDLSRFPAILFVDISNNPIKEFGLFPTLSCCDIQSLNYSCVVQYNSVAIITDSFKGDHKQVSTNYHVLTSLPQQKARVDNTIHI